MGEANQTVPLEYGAQKCKTNVGTPKRPESTVVSACRDARGPIRGIPTDITAGKCRPTAHLCHLGTPHTHSQRLAILYQLSSIHDTARHIVAWQRVVGRQRDKRWSRIGSLWQRRKLVAIAPLLYHLEVVTKPQRPLRTCLNANRKCTCRHTLCTPVAFHTVSCLGVKLRGVIRTRQRTVAASHTPPGIDHHKSVAIAMHRAGRTHAHTGGISAVVTGQRHIVARARAHPATLLVALPTTGLVLVYLAIRHRYGQVVCVLAGQHASFTSRAARAVEHKHKIPHRCHPPPSNRNASPKGTPSRLYARHNSPTQPSFVGPERGHSTTEISGF